MKNFDNLNYYEIFEIPVNASLLEIRLAYRDVLAIYDEDSLTTYSFFSNGERDRILEKIDMAFLTLIDEKKRAEYDRELKRSGQISDEEFNGIEERKATPVFQKVAAVKKDQILDKIRSKISEPGIKNIAKEMLFKEMISGNDLREFRTAIGIELDELFEITRISISMLAAIEENRNEKLPSTIYLKNFLKTYAEFFQLDPERIINGYLKSVVT